MNLRPPSGSVAIKVTSTALDTKKTSTSPPEIALYVSMRKKCPRLIDKWKEKAAEQRA